MRETKLTNACLEWLWEHGIPAFRVNSGNVFLGKRMVRGAPPGTPDIIGWFPRTGGIFGIENKVGKSGLRPAQKRWRDMLVLPYLGAASFQHFVVRSTEELSELFQYHASKWAAPPIYSVMLRELLSSPTKEKAGLARIAPKGRIVDESNVVSDLGPAVRLRRPRRAK